MPVTFREDSATSPRFSMNQGRPQWVRTGTIAWSDIDAFVLEILPPSTTYGGAGGQVAGAEFPGNANFRVSDFSIEPLGGATGGTSDGGSVTAAILSYDKAKVSITYGRPFGGASQNQEEQQEDGDPVPWLSHEWSAGAEFLTLPKTKLNWYTDPSEVVPEDANAGILVPTIEHAITWHKVLSPPFNAIRACLGKINSQRMDFATGTIYKESLLFLGAQLARDIMSDGSRAWKVGYKFSERLVFPEANQLSTEYADTFPPLTDPDDDNFTVTRGTGGWNHFWRDTTLHPGEWSRLETGSTTYIYEKMNLGILFQTQSTSP